jgi:tRNA A37 threonylcarbamoyladenosine modification protein TsaB
VSLVLFIDTTLGGFALGLADKGNLSEGLAWSKIYSERFGAAQFLATSLREGLNGLSAKPTDVSHIVVGKGPGSFTGIKIGLSFVTGLFTGKPEILLSGVSSLAILEDGLNDLSLKANKLTLATRATKAHGFGAVRSGDESFSDRSSYAFDLADTHHDCFGSDSFCTVGVWEEFDHAVMQNSGKEVRRLSMDESLRAVLKGMLENFSDLKFESYPPQPQYLKKSTAEERLEKLEN